ncbi:hypothetical protein L873DRAFT_1831812 [Choiromyces venosus 120613-1]|uniref:Pre-rRNA processing protein n=1 Tax=Choiromyces venosus 120613-1 TaxID=1336337 RepID=A0A3N4IVS5_9PEZI|nr:hypothetical protein L873DRAFT_1831812 [Choiromyces venosus 120613-1]
MALRKSSTPAPDSSTEATPLLRSNSQEAPPVSYTEGPSPTSDHDDPTQIADTPRPTRLSSIALILLCISVVSIFLVGFFAPAAAARYAKEAVVLDITSLSVDSFTDNGVKVRVQATVQMDASRVKNHAVRSLGRTGTWIANKISTDATKVDVYLPDYDGGLLGTASAPPMTISVRNGQSTKLDFVSDVKLGSRDTIRSLANDYLVGGLGKIRVLGVADLGLKSGLLHLGTQKISEEIAFEGSIYKLTYGQPELPSLPEFQVNRMDVGEITLPEQKALSVNVSAVIQNPYPVEFDVPPLSFVILLSGCKADDLVNVATAETSHLSVEPKTDIGVDVHGIVRNIPEELVTACPGSHISPIDMFLGTYLHGKDTTVYIQGSQSPGSNAPSWLLEFLQSITLPIPFPGHTFDNVVKSFSLSHVKFQLPSPDAPAGTPEASLRLSADVLVTVRLPQEMSFPLDVSHLKATADVTYEGQKFGTLHFPKWVPASSTRSNDSKYLYVQAEVRDSLLDIEDYDIFDTIVQKLLSGDGKPIFLGIDGSTDVEIGTSLGQFVVKNIPASGNIKIDGLPITQMPLPKVNEVIITDTTTQSITLGIDLDLENPTPWKAIVPYMSVHITHDGFILGNASIVNGHVVTGMNTFSIQATWDPQAHGGHKAEEAGRRLAGEYISGYNTTITIRLHANSFPSMPLLSKLLSNYNVTIPTPRLPVPGKDGPSDCPPNFIESATMHLISSSADFLLNNPLRKDKVTIEAINGTAKYKGSELGKIVSSKPFAIKPAVEGRTTTPRLPVRWKLRGVGYEAMKRALGGTLAVHAEALCLVRVGKLQMEVFYNSTNPIGANIHWR